MAIFKKLFLGDTVATSGNKCFRKLTTRNITFTIGGTQFEAEPNMTWGEWLESAYNTSGYYTKTITSGGVEYNPIIIAENGDAFTVVEEKGAVMEIGNGISANGEYLSVTLTQDNDSIVGTWVFNDTLTVLKLGTHYNIDFECDGSFYTRLIFPRGTGKLDKGCYGTRIDAFEKTVYDYSDEKWSKDVYKTITITGGSDIDNFTFQTWLKANATKQ